MPVKKLRLLERLRRTKVYHPGGYKPSNMYKQRLGRVNWEQIEMSTAEEGRTVVKGTNKRIVVVKSPDPKVFEQAIFIVKEDFLGHRGRADALREAQQVANAYIRSAVAPPRPLLRRMSGLAWAGVILGLLGLTALLLFIFL